MIIIPDSIALPFIIFIGASIGSFLNVVIYRVPLKLSIIKPSSHCISCKTSIKLFHNIPIISYLLLSGKCRYCNTKFSSRYLLIEILSTIITLILYFIFGQSTYFISYCILSYLLIAVTFIDIDHLIIPNGIVIIGIVITIIISYLSWLPIHIQWIDGLKGALLFSGFLFTIGLIGQFILKKESIGFGDTKLAIILGGFLGVEHSILALYLSFALSAVMIFIFLGMKKIKRSTKIPFGPFLSTGTIITILSQTPPFIGSNYLLNWYYNTMF